MARITEVRGTLHFEFEWAEYSIEGTAIATGKHYHDPGSMYKRNGDPGDPPEDSYYNVKITSLDEVIIYDKEGNEVENVIEDAVIYDYIKKHYDDDDIDWEG